jgi:ribulose-phosphate 3-epimerase
MSQSLGRIAKLRSLVPDSVFVQVDGGVSAQNAAEIRQAGADLLVAGSAIFWQDDLAAAYVDLTAKVTEALA